MSEPFIGEIRIVGWNFAARGWAHCNGQLLAISQNSALFSLLGTTYGGDGRTTFGLPDLRSRVAIHPGRGPGLSDYRWGQRGGAESVTLTQAQMPNHTHTLRAHSEEGEETNPTNNRLAGAAATMYAGEAADVSMNADSVTSSGGGQPHTNVQPYLGVYHIIALQGLFPSRS